MVFSMVAAPVCVLDRAVLSLHGLSEPLLTMVLWSLQEDNWTFTQAEAGAFRLSRALAAATQCLLKCVPRPAWIRGEGTMPR